MSPWNSLMKLIAILFHAFKLLGCANEELPTKAS